jgi:hypothetical protein
MTLLLIVSWLAIAALALKNIDLRYHWRWQQMSLEGRLREQRNRAEVFGRTLGRLRADWQAGKIKTDEGYGAVFERLTSEGKGAE